MKKASSPSPTSSESFLLHDIRNHLGSALSSMELLREDPNGPLAEKLMEQNHRCLLIMKTLCEMHSKTDATLSWQPLSFLFQQTIDTLRFTLPKSIEIKKNLSHPNDEILIHTHLWFNIFLNLSLNAKRSMADNGVIELTSRKDIGPLDQVCRCCKKTLARGTWICVMFKDNGKGMDGTTLKQCLKPGSTTKCESHHGLGLASVVKNMRALDGHIQVESETNIGSTFSLWFPSHNKGAYLSVNVADHSLRGKTILLLEDDETFRETLEFILQEDDAKVFTASSSDQALEFLTQHRIDLLIADVGSIPNPVPDWLAQCKTLNKEVSSALISGMDQGDLPKFPFLKKPFTASELRSFVQGVLQQLNA